MTKTSLGRFEVDLLFDECKARRGEKLPDRGEQEESIRRRLILCGTGLMAAFAILSVRTTQLALDTPAPEYRPAVVEVAEGAARLEDAEGRALALNVKGFGLAIHGREVWDVEEAVRGLTGLFPHLDEAKLRSRLSAGNRVMIDRVISEQQRDEVLALGLPGLEFPDAELRAYPQGRLFSHVVGYQIPGRGGVTGLEAAITSQELSGTKRTTLNVAAQTVLLSELQRARRIYEAQAAWGVLIDARDGGVVAMASLPDFDPNAAGASPASARRNRVVSDTYELGSAFKAMTVAMAMEEGIAQLETPVDVTSPLQVGDWAIEDYSAKEPVLTVEEIIAVSSNIGTAQLALLMGEERFTAWLETFGLTERLTTSLPEGRSPLLPASWGPAEIATASYGHGIAVSPLHLATAFTAVVNGGEFITPRFMTDEPVEKRRVISQRTSAALRRALRSVVTDGTGGKAEAPGYYVIGKTATADKPGRGGYSDKGPLIASFIGAFPGHDPRYVLLVSLDEPVGTADTYGFATAGWTAAPTFRRTVERLAPVLNLRPSEEDEAADGFLSVLGQMQTPEDVEVTR